MTVSPSLLGATVKIRAIAAAAAALVILAACGGSEPSAGSTRTKNAALETIPCAKGGLCKLGDTGPNGGIVVDIRITDKLTGQAELTEAATTNFNFPDAVGGLCTGTPPDDWSAGKRPATGLEDSTLLANKCETSPAMSLAEAAVQGSYIPSIDELLKVAKALKLAQQPLPKVKCYWSSTSAPAEYGKPVVRAIYNTESGDYVEGTRDLSSWCALRTVSLSKGRAEIGTTMTIPVATSNVGGYNIAFIIVWILIYMQIAVKTTPFERFLNQSFIISDYISFDYSMTGSFKIAIAFNCGLKFT